MDQTVLVMCWPYWSMNGQVVAFNAGLVLCRPKLGFGSLSVHEGLAFKGYKGLAWEALVCVRG